MSLPLSAVLSVDRMTNTVPNMPNPHIPDVAGFSSTYPSGTRIDDHAHDAHQLVYAISGTMRVFADQRVWVLPSKRAVWIPAEVSHRIECERQVEMRTAYLSRAHSQVPDAVSVVSVSPLAHEVLIRLSLETASDLRPSLGTILVAEVQSGTVEPFSLPLPMDTRIARLATSFRKDPTSKKTIGQWARTLGFSERNLIRAIKSETGMTFRELRRQSRVVLSIEHLVSGLSVTQTAFEVGFDTPSSFARAFREVTGYAPTEFSDRER